LGSSGIEEILREKAIVELLPRYSGVQTLASNAW